MGELATLPVKDAFGEDDPDIIFNFEDHFGADFD